MPIMHKNEEQQKWKEQMKNFISESHRNEDCLFNHNYRKTYYVATNKEIIEQFKVFGEKGLKLYQHNIRKFPYKKKNYVMITINGDNVAGTDGEMISAQAFALNFMVSGFTYLFKQHSWNEIEQDIKTEKFGIKYIKKTIK